jgi:hypothetical protein
MDSKRRTSSTRYKSGKPKKADFLPVTSLFENVFGQKIATEVDGTALYKSRKSIRSRKPRAGAPQSTPAPISRVYRDHREYRNDGRQEPNHNEEETNNVKGADGDLESGDLETGDQTEDDSGEESHDGVEEFGSIERSDCEVGAGGAEWGQKDEGEEDGEEEDGDGAEDGDGDGEEDCDGEEDGDGQDQRQGKADYNGAQDRDSEPPPKDDHVVTQRSNVAPTEVPFSEDPRELGLGVSKSFLSTSSSTLALFINPPA